MKFYTNVTTSGDKVLLRGYENGKAFSRKINYQPTLYVKGKTGPWRTIHNKVIEPISFESISEAKNFIKRYSGVDSFDIYGLPRFLYSFLNEEYTGEIQYDRELIRVANIDIEVSIGNGYPKIDNPVNEITAISLKLDNIFHVFGCGEFQTERTDIKYHKCRNEKELLASFLTTWKQSYPDIITGWNVVGFDIPYLVGRMNMVLGEDQAKDMSPWRYIYNKKFNMMQQEHITTIIEGIATLDYLELYRRFTYTTQDSYKLDSIANIELDESKLDYSEYENLQDLYERNFQKFIEYNIHDVELVDKLDDKMKLIDMAITLAYDAKVNYIDVFSQVRMWDVIINNHLLEKKVVIPTTSPHVSKDASYEGAYVKDPKVGAHDWVVSFDLNSLYPHLIMQYNISPETILTKYIKIDLETFLDKTQSLPLLENTSLAPNGWYFTNNKIGFLSEIMQRLYDDRVKYKKKMIEAQKDYEASTDKKEKKKLYKLISRYKNIQMAKKIQLNSAYGAIGSPHFRFFDLRQATAITIAGQLAIKWAEREINSYMNSILKTKDTDYVIASDTDSLYINFGPLVKSVYKDKQVSDNTIVSFLNDVSSEKIEPFIDKFYKELATRTNAYAHKMFMKREVIAKRAIWTAKKRYILNVYDSEGVRYNEPKLKISGIEAVKSSTPASCRKAIKSALDIIMNGTEDNLHSYIEQFRNEFNKMPFEDVAFPRGVQALSQYTLTDKSIPIHVRGALIYNDCISKLKLTKKYQRIMTGEKIKFCYLKMPNHLREYVISAPAALPKEFGISSSCIDYNTQFEKAFLQPLRTILSVMNWSDEKRNTLEGFFSD